MLSLLQSFQDRSMDVSWSSPFHVETEVFLFPFLLLWKKNTIKINLMAKGLFGWEFQIIAHNSRQGIATETTL